VNALSELAPESMAIEIAPISALPLYNEGDRRDERLQPIGNQLPGDAPGARRLSQSVATWSGPEGDRYHRAID
jgi:hypothetical protein